MSLANDTFTDTDGVVLESHTTDSGHRWFRAAESDGSSSLTIHSNQCWIPVQNVVESAWINVTLPSADYRVQCVVNVPNSSAGIASFPNIYGRWNVGVTDRYKLDFRVDASTAGTGTFVLSKDVAGVNTILHTFSGIFTTGTCTMQLDLVGNQITATVGGLSFTGAGAFTVTDGSITAAGVPGIAAFTTFASFPAAQVFDSYTVTDLTVAGGRALFYRPGLDGHSSAGPKQFNPSLG